MLTPHSGPDVRKLAAAATPGPWEVDPDQPAVWTLGESVAGGTVAYVNTDQQTGDHHPHGDAALIAFFDPVVAAEVAGILDRLADIIAYAEQQDDTDRWLPVLNLANGLDVDGTPKTPPTPIEDAQRTAMPLPDISELLGGRPPGVHTARVETHYTTADDPNPWAKVVCPECGTEWGWMMVLRGTGAMEKLQAMADQHNLEVSP